MHERTVFPQFVTAALSLPRIGSYSAYDLTIIPFDAFFCAKKVDCCEVMPPQCYEASHRGVNKTICQ